ncbi:alcohol dehydrogenase, partial [Jimgerdemannia flammicorona]
PLPPPGTGSETTGTSIFDYEPLHVKTGIAHRALKPLLGIVDPLNTRSMPSQVHAASGLDVLCHALESYTAIPYHLRTPRPKNPLERPAYQGSNPISDVWSLHALRMTVEYLPRAVRDPEDHEAHAKMLLAATFAGGWFVILEGESSVRMFTSNPILTTIISSLVISGIGFGNAGVHLCHGMSYPISGLNKTYQHPGYNVGHPIVPHGQSQRMLTSPLPPLLSRPPGVSVAVTAPAVFRFTAVSSPDRHLEAAKIFGADISHAAPSTAGPLLAERITGFLDALNIPNGISGLGYTASDIPTLVKGTLPQHRVTKLAPAGAPGEEELAGLFEDALKNY